MYAKVTIGSKEVEMAASAATPFFYSSIFKGKDLMKEQAPLFSGKVEPAESFGLIYELAFVMAMSAEKKLSEMRKLTEDNFAEWLEQFDMGEMLEAANEILAVYIGNSKMLSASKKETGPQTGLTQ